MMEPALLIEDGKGSYSWLEPWTCPRCNTTWPAARVVCWCEDRER